MNPEQPKPPRRAFDLTLHLGGDTWQDVVDLLRTLADHVVEHGPECDMVTGGCASGGYVQVIRDPAMTHDAYVEAVERYLAECRQRRADHG